MSSPVDWASLKKPAIAAAAAVAAFLLALAAALAASEDPTPPTTTATSSTTSSSTTSTSTTSTTTTSTTTPPAGQRPSASTTGNITPETQLTKLTSAQAAEMLGDGQNLSKVAISGQLTLTPAMNDRHLTDFIINGSGSYGVRSTDGATGFVMEDGLIRNVTSTNVYGGGWTGRRLELTKSGGDCVKPTSNVVLEASWCHGIGTAAGSHADFVQFQITSGSANVRVDRNFCDMGISTLQGTEQSNACVQLNEGVTKLTNVTFTGNWLTGGNYTVNCSGPSASSLKGTGTVFGGDTRYGNNTGCSAFK